MDHFDLFKFKKEETSLSQFDEKCASFLHRKLSEKHQIKGKRPNLKKWTLEFQRLRTIDGIKKSQIKRALKWYCKNIRKEHVPLILSARSFRAKFPQLEMAMQITIEKGNQVILSEVKVKDLAYDIDEECGYLRWPDKNKNQDSSLKPVALKLIQACINEYENYQDLLSALVPKVSDYHNSVIDHIFGRDSIRSFVRKWMLGVHQTAWEWSGWKGNLDSYVFNFNSSRYKRYVEDVIHDFCIDSECWEILREYLNRESQTRTRR